MRYKIFQNTQICCFTKQAQCPVRAKLLACNMREIQNFEYDLLAKFTFSVGHMKREANRWPGLRFSQSSTHALGQPFKSNFFARKKKKIATFNVYIEGKKWKKKKETRPCRISKPYKFLIDIEFEFNFNSRCACTAWILLFFNNTMYRRDFDSYFYLRHVRLLITFRRKQCANRIGSLYRVGQKWEKTWKYKKKLISLISN